MPEIKINSFRDRINAKTRLEFINCLSNGHFSIEHKIDVHQVMGEGGSIDYNDESIEFNIKSARMANKKDKHGGNVYFLKVIVE